MSGPEVVLMAGGGLGTGVSRVSDVSLLTDFDLRLPSGLAGIAIGLSSRGRQARKAGEAERLYSAAFKKALTALCRALLSTAQSTG
jgi:hypothetical protein